LLNGKRVEAQRKEDLDDFMSAHKVCGVLSEIKVVATFCARQAPLLMAVINPDWPYWDAAFPA
jgi:hypothetical protein